MIGCLRSLGLPARYVSGYLRTRPLEPMRAARRRRLARLGLGLCPRTAGSTSTRPTTCCPPTNTSPSPRPRLRDVTPPRRILGGGRHRSPRLRPAASGGERGRLTGRSRRRRQPIFGPVYSSPSADLRPVSRSSSRKPIFTEPADLRPCQPLFARVSRLSRPTPRRSWSTSAGRSGSPRRSPWASWFRLEAGHRGALAQIRRTHRLDQRPVTRRSASASRPARRSRTRGRCRPRRIP